MVEPRKGLEVAQMSRHTPGPWKVVSRERGIFRVESELYVVCEEIVGAFDANLIASAPKMLEALERCEELLSSITDIRSDLAEFQNGYLRQARTAIAKARGE